MTSDERRKGSYDKGRTVLNRKLQEEPKSARANKRYYQLWKFLENLKPEELQLLITKRKNDIKYLERDVEKLNILKTEILIIEDAYRIIKRKIKEENI